MTPVTVNAETSTEKRHAIMRESFNEFMLMAFFCSPHWCDNDDLVICVPMYYSCE
ncbi:hypothetical protein ABVT39_006893 [Epinephelus coioides]